MSIVAYDQTYSAPLGLVILLDTYIWILLAISLLVLYIYVSKKRRRSGLSLIKPSIIKYLKSHKLRFIIIGLLTFGLLFILLIMWIQPYILYHPNHSEFAYERLIELDKYQSYEITDENYTYHGFGYVDQLQTRPTIIYFGGNGESSAQTFYNYDQSDIFDYFIGYNFIMIDYPGYGLSEGKTSDHAMIKMAESVFDYVASLSYVDQTQIYVYGYSIGTGVATYIASTRDVKGLILIAPYSNITDLFNTRLPIFKGLGSLLIQEEFESNIYAKDVIIKPLIIMSKEDQTIPYELSMKLVDAFIIEPTVLILDSGAHNEFLDHIDVLDYITDYINQ